MNAVASAALVAAEKQLTEDTVRPGLLGLVFFVGLFVATYFLWRSMNKQLKRVDAHFAEDEDASEPTAERDTSVQEKIAIDQAELGRRGAAEAKADQASPAATESPNGDR